MSKKMTFQPTTSDTNIRQTEVTANWLQEETHEGLSASYICVTQGHGNQGNIKRLRNNQLIKEVQRAAIGLYVESPSITKIARVTRTTKLEDSNTTRTVKYRKLAYQEKAGELPHTLQERRPRDNKETQRNSQTDEVQQIEQQ